MVRAAESRVHPHERWLQGYRENGKRLRKYVLANRLGISSGHLSSIYSGDFAPSEELAKKMAAVTRGACSKREILAWHRKNPPVWSRGEKPRKAAPTGRLGRKRKRSSEAAQHPDLKELDPRGSA